MNTKNSALGEFWNRHWRIFLFYAMPFVLMAMNWDADATADAVSMYSVSIKFIREYKFAFVASAMVLCSLWITSEE